MTNLSQLPQDLPVPLDDGAANHLKGLRLPNIELQSTKGGKINLSALPGKVVIYCYPMTGRPDVPLPEGWVQIPELEVVRLKVVHTEITTKICNCLVPRFLG